MKFGNWFQHPILKDVLPKNLCYLRFGDYFNSPITYFKKTSNVHHNSNIKYYDDIDPTSSDEENDCIIDDTNVDYSNDSSLTNYSDSSDNFDNSSLEKLSDFISSCEKEKNWLFGYLFKKRKIENLKREKL